MVGDDNNSNGQGAAYVFTINGSSATQMQKLAASNGLQGDRFGQSVALSPDGTVALVGAPSAHGGRGVGAAYVFGNAGQVWTQQAELFALPTQTVPPHFFGRAVTLGTGTAFVESLPAADAFTVSTAAVPVPALGNKVGLLALAYLATILAVSRRLGVRAP
jgi:hypothetical protein